MDDQTALAIADGTEQAQSDDEIMEAWQHIFDNGFGLLPMASGISVDLLAREIEVGGPIASFWVQLASAIVSGLTFATVLTLIVTPAMLMLPQSLKEFMSRVGVLIRSRNTALER